MARVAIAREGQHTTFSVSINPFGDRQGFALVLPVPSVLPRESVRTLDGGLFARLDGWSAPRHVSNAGCPVDYGYAEEDAGGCGGLGCYADAALARGDALIEADGSESTVEVEAEYLVGDYEITILSAEESGDLQAWLDGNAYYLPEGSAPMLQEYIDAGSYFLAAKVAEAAAEADGTPLPPLQVEYDHEVFAIPIRLATLNSPGVQDMVIYAVTDRYDAEGGTVGIANYSEMDVGDGCAWGDPASESFDEFYTDHFASAYERAGTMAWSTEFASGPNEACSPCTNVYLEPLDLEALGFQGYASDAWLTRLRARYAPAEAVADLTLYGSGVADPVVTSFADAVAANYTCIAEFCDGTPTPGNDAAASASVAPRGLPGWGAVAAGAILAVVGARRRRR